MCRKILREKMGCEELLCMSRKSKTSERKRKKRKKIERRVFSVFPRVSSWGSGNEKVSYECREPTKFQGEIYQPLKHTY